MTSYLTTLLPTSILITISSQLSPAQDYLLDNGYLPHSIIRLGIRQLLAQRIALISSTSLAESYNRKMAYVELLRTRPIAIETAKANEQHYEVDTSVLRGMLGPRMKYSCCLYSTGKETLGQAEIAMLESYVSKAEIKDGMRILDLGCGWGSATLYFAERFKGCEVVGFSNSSTQRMWILSEAERRGLGNVNIITGDVAQYSFEGLEASFDRVVSIELFEHMKNYDLLMRKVGQVLKPGGKLFVHIFAHRQFPYDFEGGWMSDYFFTGGTMPSADLLLWFQDELVCKRQWWVNGQHYAKTCEDWLTKMLRCKREIWPGLVKTYGEEKAGMWWYRWQVFYMACAELFAYNGGDEWGVCHFLFEKKG
jgi:cation-transporting P-type ATPase 13A2